MLSQGKITENQPKSNTRSIQVYLWNPCWEQFQHLSLTDKIQSFKSMLCQTQETFTKTADNDENTVGLIIAPEAVFSPPKIQNSLPAYTIEEHDAFVKSMNAITASIDTRILVIAGTIDYFTLMRDKYKVTSYILTCNTVLSYDKKNDVPDIKIEENYVPLETGKQSSIIYFRDLVIGLEICRDHEEKALLNELKGNPVNIHILICNTQTKRHASIATNKENEGLFIVCELEPKKASKIMYRNEISQCYKTKTITSTQQLQNNGNNNRTTSALFARLPSIATTTNLQELEKTSLDSDISLTSTEITIKNKMQPPSYYKKNNL